MYLKAKLFALSALSFILGHPSFAQQEDSTVIELKNLTITYNRIEIPFSESARSIQIITREQIEASPGQSLADVLSNVPGIDLRQRGPAGVQADVGIRGGTFEQTLILINGIKMTDPQSGHHTMNIPVDIDNIERIEVLKGPAARIYGQNAFSGAINIITKVPEKPQVNAGIYGGDFTTFGGNASIALPDDAYGQYLSVAYDQSDGYRFNTDYNIRNAFYQSYLKTTSGQFNLMAGHTMRDFGASGYYYVPNSEEYESVNTTFASLGYEHKSSTWRLQPRVYWRRNHDDYILIRSKPEVYHNIHTTHVLGSELNATSYNKLGLTGLGVEARRETINSNNLGEWGRTTVGFFAEHRLLLLNKIDITPGVYANWYTDFGFNIFPGLDASIDLTPSLKAFANTGRSFRVPTYTELYYTSPNNMGNPEIQPEKAWTHEAGFKFFGTNFWSQISYFNRDASQLIDWIRSTDSAAWVATNIDNVAIQGLEISTNFTFSREQWVRSLSLNYTYVDAQLQNPENIQSRYALDNLKHQLIMTATHKIYGKISHRLNARYLNRVSFKDYLVIDSRVFFQNDMLNVYAEATNLTNTEYTEQGYVPMPGRWFRAGLDVTLGW